MENTRFDRLTSSLANTESRRGVLRVIAAVTIGAGSLSVLHQDDASARRKHHKKHKGGGNVWSHQGSAADLHPGRRYL